jgi:bacillithiol biosynthesis cysteine-adding enzyme BshC
MSETLTPTAMKCATVDLGITGALSPLAQAYVDGHERVRAFYAVPFGEADILASVPGRKYDPGMRALLVSVLRRQYAACAGLSRQEAVERNLDLLAREGTFTVTTGHQLNIFTGPLYFIYKICGAVSLAKRLQRDGKGNFVPVYWMAGEDHDLEEINHTQLAGQRLSWETGQRGAVGRMHTEGLEVLTGELESLLGTLPHAPELVAMFRKAYDGRRTMAEAMRLIVHELFGKYGVIVLDPDTAELKQRFAGIMADDALHHTPFRLVGETMRALEPDYKAQVHPREVNLFYLGDGMRARIDAAGHGYRVADSSMTLDAAMLEDAIRNHPERFSPNVVLRPLYQSLVLPDVATVGGPAEISYWLEYKSMFDHYGVHFPCLALRPLALLLDKSILAKMEKLGWREADLFRPTDALLKEYVQRHNDLSYFERARGKSGEAFDELSRGMEAADPTLKASAEAERQRMLKGIQTLEDKVNKALKRKSEQVTAQAEKVKEALFPGGKGQERHDNFSPWYAQYGPAFLDALVEKMDPLEKRFFVVEFASEH